MCVCGRDCVLPRHEAHGCDQVKSPDSLTRIQEGVTGVKAGACIQALISSVSGRPWLTLESAAVGVKFGSAL